MKKFQNHQCPHQKCRFDIVGHKKAYKIWCDSPFKWITFNAQSATLLDKVSPFNAYFSQEKSAYNYG